MPTNHTRQVANTVPEILLARWAEFDQSRWLRAELGKNYDSVVEGGEGWPSIAPGVVDGTSVEAYRARQYTNISLVGANLQGIPLTLYVENAASTALQIDNLTAFQGPELLGCTFDGVDLSFAFLAAAHIRACHLVGGGSLARAQMGMILLEDTVARRIDFRGAFLSGGISGCTFEKCDFDGATFGALNTGLYTEIDNSRFTKCSFRAFDAELLYVRGTQFCECDFTAAELDFNEDENRNAWRDSVFTSCNFTTASISFMHMNDALVQHSEFRRATLTSCELSEFFQCDFERAAINGCTIEGNFRGNNLRNVLFSGETTFAGADVSGCDFTGSNLNSLYATKALLRAAVTYDAGTLWVDGTPLTTP